MRTTKKRPKASGVRRKRDPLSLGALDKLWSKVVKRRFGCRCIVCDQAGDLESHHIVHRRASAVLRIDPDNGVPACGTQVSPYSRHGESCHAWLDTLAGQDYVRSFVGEEIWTKLQEKQRVLKPDELLADGLSERDWRRRWRTALEEELRRG